MEQHDKLDNNDILRKLRYTFDFDEPKIISLFALADYIVTKAQVVKWLHKENHTQYERLEDKELAVFLNGLIIEKRGLKDGVIPVPEFELDNNIIFRKLRIALQLKDDDILEYLMHAGLKISPHELSAFFRKPGQKQYRKCKNQILRRFLQGLQFKHKGD